jgi:toxin ParE1/3/4
LSFFLPPNENSSTVIEYEQRARGLGLELIAEVQRMAHIVVDRQSIGPKLDPIHRRLALRRFPFALIYRADAEAVRIVAVAHRRRRPSYWQLRVQER